jgi:hypothetical protein
MILFFMAHQIAPPLNPYPIKRFGRQLNGSLAIFRNSVPSPVQFRPKEKETEFLGEKTTKTP